MTVADARNLGEQYDLARYLQVVVLPVMQEMVRPGESVERIDLGYEGSPPSHGRSDVVLTLVIEGETFSWIAITQEAPTESDADAQARLASEFQDYLAESSFARGELRAHPFS